MTITAVAWLKRKFSDPMSRFLPLFFLYLGIVGFLGRALFQGHPEALQLFSEKTALLIYWMLVPFADDVGVLGKTIAFSGFKVIVVAECVGVWEFMLFAAAVFAYPARWRQKGIGLLFGIPVLYVFNVLRIIGLLVVGRYGPDLFDFMHIYFWQATTIILIGAVWLGWVRLAVVGSGRAAVRY